MFGEAEREQIRARLVDLARQDQDVAAAAHVGSYVAGTMDRWSDIDFTVAVRGPLHEAMARWTSNLCEEFSVVHYWDLPYGPTVYRVFLLSDWLELDISFTPEMYFRPGGPDWQLLFGSEGRAEHPATPAPVDNAVGLCWHHLLHATAALARGRLWQAEWLVSEARHHLLQLACRRYGLVEMFGKGSDDLPSDVQERLAGSLISPLTPRSVQLAVAATADAFLCEITETDERLAQSLRPMLQELTLAAEARDGTPS